MGAPTRGRPLVYRRVLTDTSPESLSCALAHIACGLHSASAAVNTKLALQLVRAFAAYFRERAWPLLLMRGALAALSPCSWDLMPRHLCGRSILSDGASPPAAPSLFGSHPPSPWWHAKLSRYHGIHRGSHGEVSSSLCSRNGSCRRPILLLPPLFSRGRLPRRLRGGRCSTCGELHLSSWSEVRSAYGAAAGCRTLRFPPDLQFVQAV